MDTIFASLPFKMINDSHQNIKYIQLSGLTISSICEEYKHQHDKQNKTIFTGCVRFVKTNFTHDQTHFSYS